MSETDGNDVEVPYDPPRVERVLTPEELAREIQYAGATAATFDN
jgi:hypothetical protein